MRFKLLLRLSLGISLAPIIALALNQPSYARQKYRCNTSQETPTTDVLTARAWEPLLVYKSNYFDPYISKKERCQIVSRRLQAYDDNKMMPYLTSRKNVNGHPVICVAERMGGKCLPEDVVVTLVPGTNPTRVLKQILGFRNNSGPGRINVGTNKLIYYNGEFYLNLNELTQE